MSMSRRIHVTRVSPYFRNLRFRVSYDPKHALSTGLDMEYSETTVDKLCNLNYKQISCLGNLPKPEYILVNRFYKFKTQP